MYTETVEKLQGNYKETEANCAHSHVFGSCPQLYFGVLYATLYPQNSILQGPSCALI